MDIVDRSQHKYFTQIPNIIFHLGLSAYELALYFAIKRTAGAGGGASKKGRKRLAVESGMSTGMVTKTKTSLMKSHDLLSGKPLIKITKRKSSSGDDDVDLIEIMDIWDESAQYFLDQKKKKVVTEQTGGGHSMTTGSHSMTTGGHGMTQRRTSEEEPVEEGKKEREKKESSGATPPNPPPPSKKKPSEKEHKNKYGSDGLVLLTSTEYNKLFTELGKDVLEDLIVDLDLGIASKGYEYKSHYHTIKKWYLRNLKDGKAHANTKKRFGKDRSNREGCSDEQNEIYDNLF